MKDNRFARFVVFVNGAVPLLMLAHDWYWKELGADPVNFAIRTTGMLALVFLLLSLVVTPARKITGLNWLFFFRRTLGLYAFFYASVHFSIFFALDRSFSVSSTLHEMIKRVYLLVGSTGLLLMVPLAATSTNGMIKRLGAKRWKALHRLVYFAAIAGVIHYYMQVKADVRQPIAFIAVLALLLGFRLVAYLVAYLTATDPAKVARGFPVANVPKEEMAKAKFWKGTLRVAGVTDETPSVRTFRLVPVNGSDLPFDFLPGQYLNLSLLIDGKKVNRSFTIASTPTHADYCEITVKREENGIASAYLHDHVREGTLLNISAPAGRFTFNGTEASSIVLIAGGVGITPLMSVIRYLTDRHWGGDIHLIDSVRTESDIIFRDELTDLQERFPNLHICTTLTQPERSGWSGLKGRITSDLLKRTVTNLAARRIHLCGPGGMMEEISKALLTLGVPPEQIKSEAFYSVNPAVTESADSPADIETPQVRSLLPGTPAVVEPNHVIEFSVSRKFASVPSRTTVLEAAESVGVEIDYECRSGICGRCKTKLLNGVVTMETQDALDSSDRMNNLILACQAVPSENVTVHA